MSTSTVHVCMTQGSVSNLLSLLLASFTSVTPHISAPSDQVCLFIHPTHDYRLGSLLLLNRCRRLPSPFKMNVASCFSALPISLLVWLSCSLSFCTCQICFTCSGLMVVVKVLRWWVLYCKPRLWSQQTSSSFLWRCSHKVLVYYSADSLAREEILQSLSLWASIVSFYLAKTELNVSDKMVDIHPNCPPVDSEIGRYALCISR